MRNLEPARQDWVLVTHLETGGGPLCSLRNRGQSGREPGVYVLTIEQ